MARTVAGALHFFDRLSRIFEYVAIVLSKAPVANAFWAQLAHTILFEEEGRIW